MVPRDRFLLRLSLTIACLAHSLTAWSYSQAVDCNEAALLAGIAQANSNGGGTITFNCQNQTILLGQGLGEFQGNLVLDGENRNITIEYFPSGLFAGCVPGNNGIFGPAIAELTGGNNVVRNLTFKNFLESLQISGPNNTIEDNTFLAHQCSDDGLSTIDVAAVGTLIQRNLLQDYEDKAFQMSFGGGTVTDNTFIDTKQPIRAPFDNSAGDTFFVTDNLFTTTPGNSGLCDGVRITGTYHIVFERNTHSFCKRGVRLGELGGVGGLEAEVRDNIINDNQQAGIRVGGDARVSLSGNTIEDNGSVPGSLPEGGVVVWENAEADLGGGSLMIGGQPLSSIGQNTLTGNNVVDVRNLRAGFTVRAENNCWDNSTLGDVLAQDVEGTVAVDPIAVSCGAATTTTTSTTTSTTTTTTSSTTTTTIPTTTSTTTTSSSSTTSTSSTSTSSTSSTTSTTLGEGVDNDSDGVDDDVESNAPNGGDGNQDGMPDSQQGNVVSLPNAVDNRYVTLVVGESNGITGVSASDLSPPGTPVGVDFPIGFLDFTTDSETVEIVVPQGVIVNSWWKFGPTLENDTAHLYEFPVFDGTLGTEILNDQDRILLHFVDGQRGDDDLQVNGTITDLGGPAFAVPAAVPGALSRTTRLISMSFLYLTGRWGLRF